MKNVKRRLSFALAAAVLANAAVATGVQASGVYDQGKWDDRGTDVDCGGLVIDWHDRGNFIIENATAVSHYQFFRESFWKTFTTVVTNPLNGKTITERYTEYFHEGVPTWLGKSVLSYRWPSVGTYTIKRANGHFAYADAGLIVTKVVYDS